MAELDKVFFVPGLDKIQVEVDMLDFSYIEKCNDWVKLLKIVETLKSGHEGHYPEVNKGRFYVILDCKPSEYKITFVLYIVDTCCRGENAYGDANKGTKALSCFEPCCFSD